MNQKSFNFVDIDRDKVDASRLARRSDPESSHQAARKHIKSGRAASNRKRLLDAVHEHPGLTSKQYAKLTGIDRVEAARRLPDLARSGEIKRVVPEGGGEIRWNVASS